MPEEPEEPEVPEEPEELKEPEVPEEEQMLSEGGGRGWVHARGWTQVELDVATRCEGEVREEACKL